MPDGEWAETDERKMDSNAKIQCECTTCAHSQHVCEANVTKGEEVGQILTIRIKKRLLISVLCCYSPSC